MTVTQTYTVHCGTDYNASNQTLFVEGSGGIQDCAQRCSDYTANMAQECMAATYVNGTCYGVTGSLVQNSDSYAAGLLKAGAFVVNDPAALGTPVFF